MSVHRDNVACWRAFEAAAVLRTHCSTPVCRVQVRWRAACSGRGMESDLGLREGALGMTGICNAFDVVWRSAHSDVGRALRVLRGQDLAGIIGSAAGASSIVAGACSRRDCGASRARLAPLCVRL